MAAKVKSKIDEMREAIASAGNGDNGSFLLFKDNERETFRFTTDLEDAVGPVVIYEPKKFGDGNRFAGPENFGEDVEEVCDGLDMEKYRKAMYYFFPIYSRDKEKCMILMAKASSKSILNNIIEYHLENETLMDRDYSIKRTGKGLSTTYTMNSKSPSKVTKAVAEEAEELTREVIMKAVKAFFSYPAPDGDNGDGEDSPKGGSGNGSGKGKSTKGRSAQEVINEVKNGKGKGKAVSKGEKLPWEDEDGEEADEDEGASKSKFNRAKLDMYDEDEDGEN